MNVNCIAMCMFFSHELMFHSLCDHCRQADKERTEGTNCVFLELKFYLK